MMENDVYKYLGMQQARVIEHTKIKETLMKEYICRLEKICSTDLDSKNLVKAINTFAIPVLSYSFGVVTWSDTDIESIQRKIRTTLTKFRKHHPRSNTVRLTLPRVEGGRGISDIRNIYNNQIKSLRAYFNQRKLDSPLHAGICLSDQAYTPLNLGSTEQQSNEVLRSDREKIQEWKSMSLHGRHPHDLERSDVDKIASNDWLRSGCLFPETEAFLCAIQDQVIDTKNYQKYITKNGQTTDDRCRKCYEKPETIQHIIGACSTLSQTDYLHRHNQLANIIHQELAQCTNLLTEKLPYYKYIPKAVMESVDYKLYYDRTIITDKTIHNNRPDITFVNKKAKTAFLIDIAVPNTHNIQHTINEKIRKYTDLKSEIKRIWNLNEVHILPIVISTTGIVPSNLCDNIRALGINPSLFRVMQKAVILNTTRITRKFLEG